MKVCTFCGCKTDDKSRTCASCGSSTFMYVCPNCQNHFEGAYCPDCGTRFNAVAHTCPKCSTKYCSNACPECGYKAGDASASYGSRRTYLGDLSISPNTRMAFIFSILGLSIMPFIFSPIALILTIKERKADNKSSLLTVSLALSIMGLVIAIGYLLFMILSVIINLAR